MLEPPKTYIDALQRSGLHVRHWSVRPFGIGRRGEHCNANGQPLQHYAAWSGGDIGVFITDMGSETGVTVDSVVSSDFLAVGIPQRDGDSVAISLTLDHVKVPITHQASLQFFRKGANFHIDADARGRLRTVTLLLKPELLVKGEKPGISALPALLRSMRDSAHSPVIHVHLPAAVERLVDELISAPSSMAFASLFLRAKSSEISWRILNHLKALEETGEQEAIGWRLRRGVENARHLIDEDPARRRNIEEMARYAGMNRTQLRALFKQLYGMTISEYRTTILMQKAEDLIQNRELSVAEIGYLLGYADASSFSVAYKRFYGHAPRSARIHYN